MVEPTRLPEDVLRGMPIPLRGRWQPMRAGIVGIFRYDAQVFAFHNGRLLLRGNNGNGKSMALEVLLPYVLDADLSPERLSTFGGRSRGMYTWLLGHDKTEARESARGYVWVEFGRIGEDGAAQYFTVGAGLEAARSSKDVKAWYFTSEARFGLDLPAMRPGQPAPKRDELEGQLAQAAANGLAGAVRRPKDHRDECRRVLYGVDAYTYDALRKALLQLRKPKLSDRLSEQALGEILRAALAPLDDSVLRSIAEGYEKLDEHNAEVEKLREIRSALGKLEGAYTRYARTELGERAAQYLQFAQATANVADTARRLAADAQRLELQAQKESGELTTAQHEITRLQGEIEGLKASEDYKEGQDLEPRRKQTEALEELARELLSAAATAQDEANTAGQQAADAEKAHGTALGEARQAREKAARAAAVTALTGAAHRDLAEQIDAAQAEDGGFDHTVLDALSTEVDAAVDAVRERAANLQRLHRLADDAAGQAADRERELKAAGEAAEAVSGTLQETAEQIAGLQSDLAVRTTAWAGTLTQLLLGAQPPVFEPEHIETQAPAWARRAGELRRGQLQGVQPLLTTAETRVHLLTEQTTAATAAAERCTQTAAAAHTARENAEAARAQWQRRVATWRGTLVELIEPGSAPPIPDGDAGPEPWQRWCAEARTARERAIRIAHSKAVNEHAALGAQIAPLLERKAAAETELAELHVGGSTPPPAPHTRVDGRTDRAGAPFYTLTDFRDENLSPEAAASLEAALVASGLADAWVSPGGSLQRSDGSLLLDTQLTPGPPVARSLADALRVDAHGATQANIADTVAEAILASIQLADSAPQAPTDTALVVGWDGTWRAGVLHGAYRQPVARLIGTASRERARLARIAELESEIDLADRHLEPLNRRTEQLEQQRRDLEAAAEKAVEEQQSLPDTEELGRAENLVQIADANAAAALEPAHPAAIALARAATAALRQAEHITRACDTGQRPETDPDDQYDEDENEPPELPEPAERLGALTGAITHATEAARSLRSRIEDGARALQDHADAVQRELDALPSDESLTDAHTRLARAQTELAGIRQSIITLTATRDTARELAREQNKILTAALTEAGFTTPDALAGLDGQINTWHRSCTTYLNRLERAEQTRLTCKATLERSADLTGKAGAAKDKAAGPEREATAARTAYATMLSRLGASFAAIEEQLADTEGSLATTSEHAETLAGQLHETNRQAAVAGERAEAADNSHREILKQNTERAQPLLDACRHHLPHAAGWSSPTDQDLTIANAETIARYIAGLADTDSPTTAESAANTVLKARHEAEAALGGRLALIEHTVGKILLIEVRRGASIQALAEASAEIRAQQISLDNLINTEEAELLEKFLTSDVRRQVVTRISAARAQIKTMNSLMEKHGTASGVEIQLRWIPDRKAGIGDDVIDLLDADFTSAPSARTRLMAFFAGRIALIRARNDGRSWYEQLAEMLDYRLWYRFNVMFRHGKQEDWAQMSSTDHNALSGGEKSVALHLPLFAAAAAHALNATVRDTQDPKQPGCPRLILLDEVFAGVDEDNRGKLFNLIRALDMDLVATSESETGMYAELDGIAIYHLITHQSMPGTLAVRSIWDGTDSHDLLDEDLARA
ncbi:MAG TPA: SbcC/MukB-like Walker B domain-containing protein [Actinospica sp.]|jgi:hypothetical protein|nr:SbcC/MukB-like Walker B domain-containing protein [Actinospica sp.]